MESKRCGSFVFLFLVIIVLSALIPHGLSSRNTIALESTDHPTKVAMFPAEGTALTPSPDLGIVNWTSKHLSNPSFEQWDDSITPSEWEVFAPDQNLWYATDPPWNVSQGTYSGGMEIRTRYAEDMIQWSQTNINADAQNSTLSFDYYVNQNFDGIDDNFHVEMGIYDGVTYRYLEYYLNGTTSSTNSSNRGYYLLNGSCLQWNTIVRNITADFLAIPNFPDTINPSLEIRSLRFQIDSSPQKNDYLRAFIDDVLLLNATNSYIWIGPGTRNGDFEGTGSWVPSSSFDPAEVVQSSPGQDENLAINITIQSKSKYCYAGLFQDFTTRLTSDNQGTLSFWWRTDDVQFPNFNTRSHIELYCRNETNTFTIHYYLYYGTAPGTNTSNSLFIEAKGCNTTGSWIHFNRNIWADAAEYFHTDEISPYRMGFMSQTWGSGRRIVTLLDNIGIISAAINGEGFEDQRNPDTPIRGWHSSKEQFRVTETSFQGSKAANLTLVDGQSLYVHQSPERPLNGTRETYFDVSWRLEDFTEISNNYMYLHLSLYNGTQEFSMVYFLAVSSEVILVNSSNIVYFILSEANTVGSWIQMHRDLTHDYKAAFGSLLPETVITSLTLFGITDSGDRLELLMDDLYLYDDPAPRITNVDFTPTTPDVNESVQISADVEDQDIAEVLIHYRINSSDWVETLMTKQAGVTFVGTISSHLHNSLVEFYVTANDTWGMMTTILDYGVYWNFTVTDQTPPAINSIEQVPIAPNYQDAVSITADITDSGSGVNSTVLWYRLNDSSWHSIEMLNIGGNNYQGDIPAQSTDTLVEYYVNSTDNVGLFTVDDNSGNYYDYTSSSISTTTATTTSTTTTTGTSTTPTTTILGLPRELVILAIISIIGAGIIIGYRRRKP